MRHTLVIVALGIKYYYQFSNENDNKGKTTDIDTSTTANARKNDTHYWLMKNKMIAMILQVYFDFYKYKAEMLNLTCQLVSSPVVRFGLKK